jgi:hypothetical protein
MAHDPDVSDRQLTGIYANYCSIGHNLLEFVLDFGQRYSEDAPPRFHTRIVTTPAYMHEFLVAMGEAMQQYRAALGEAADAARKDE